MTSKQFEIYINLLLKAYGYISINPTNRINGRGTIHQIDALGINKLTPTFSYPITLIAEAKYYRNDKIVGIEILRNFYGVLSDIRQNLPRKFVQPSITGNSYKNGTSNIVGLIISTVGFSSYAKSFAYSHGIFLITVNYIKKYHSPFFANLGGQTVIIQVPDKLKLDVELRKIRAIKYSKISGDEIYTFIDNTPLDAEIKLIKKIAYNNDSFRPEHVSEKEEIVNCFKYEIYIPVLKSTLSTISQHEILEKTLLTIELPQSLNYLTIIINSVL